MRNIRSFKFSYLLLIAIGVALLSTLWIVWMVDPMQAGWMPKCIFKMATGFDCPSCGATRATHALLHGHFKEALAYNYFLPFGLAYLLLVSMVVFIPVFSKTRLKKLMLGRKAAIVYILIFCTWWIVRNLTWFKELV